MPMVSFSVIEGYMLKFYHVLLTVDFMDDNLFIMSTWGVASLVSFLVTPEV